MSGPFNSNTNATPVEPSAKLAQQKDLMDQPITPLPQTPLAPKPDDAEHPILASSNDGAQDSQDAKDPNSQAFKPQVFRRKSSNYEDAAKRASLGSSGGPSVGNASALEQLEELSGSGGSTTTTTQKGPGDPSWEPKLGRQQSFERQDWKHDLQQAAVGEVAGPERGVNEVLGFTEAGSETHNKRYSQS